MAKILILFYSQDGSTRKIAQYLSKELNLPCEEIQTVKKKETKTFFKFFYGGGEAIAGMKPDLQPIKADLKNYDTIILGSPVWAGRFTPAIKTLLEKGLLRKKKIAFFYCSGGGPGKIDPKIKTSVGRYNTLISTISLTKVDVQLESQKKVALDWAKKIME